MGKILFGKKHFEAIKKTTDEVNKALNKYGDQITNGDCVCILEVVKQDIILNTGMVVINGEVGPLKIKKKKNKRICKVAHCDSCDANRR